VEPATLYRLPAPVRLPGRCECGLAAMSGAIWGSRARDRGRWRRDAAADEWCDAAQLTRDIRSDTASDCRE